MAALGLPDTRSSPPRPALQHWPTREAHVTEAAAGSLGSRRACSHRAGHVEPEPAPCLLHTPPSAAPCHLTKSGSLCQTLHSRAGVGIRQELPATASAHWAHGIKSGHTSRITHLGVTDSGTGTLTPTRTSVPPSWHTTTRAAGDQPLATSPVLPSCWTSHGAPTHAPPGILPLSRARDTLHPSLGWPCQPTRGSSLDAKSSRKVSGAMERMAVAQPSPACLAKLANPQSLEKSSPMPGMDFSHMYQLYKPRRGLKKNEDCKDSYKLPHRLIEKKRRDRINECIAQLKDLLPEHLKLTTLGHLEKAVVLELTLKHVKALTNLIEQQQQKILSLQSNGAQAVDLPPPDADSMQDIFRSGFQVCAKEVLQYLAEQDSEGNDLEPSQLVSHLQRVAADSLHGGAARPAPESSSLAPEQKEKASSLVRATEGHGKNCVPVIQRTFAHLSGEQSGSDTDTDSGYGGELEKHETSPTQQYYQKESPLAYHLQERVSHIKKESEDIPAKRPRRDTSDEEGSPFCASDMSSSHSFLGPHPHQHPLCLPFYLLPPSSTAYLPMLDKCWYPGSMPVLYPGLSASAAALSGLLGTDKGSSLLMPPRLPSPGSALSPLDSSALMQALKQIPPLNLESKD